MKEPFQHPLDKIYQNNSLLLLEAMIPYVDPSLKLPLAMLIKLQELRILMQVLNNPSRMDACGLNRGTGNSDELINSLCKAMGFDFMEQFNKMQNMMNTMNVMQSMQNMQNPGASFPDSAAGMQDLFNFAARNPDQTDSGVQESHAPSSEAGFQDFSDPSSEEEFHGFSSDTKNDMIDAIRQILSEQEEEEYES